MSQKLRATLVCVCIVLSGTLALAAVPVTVFPDPIQFGIVPLNSTSSPVFVFLSNSSANSVTISGVSISGTNQANFAFQGFNCVVSISADQNCQMLMTFTPSAMGN